MIEQINNYFTVPVIYLWLNIGVLPFWLVLIFFPNSGVIKYMVRSIFPFMIFVTFESPCKYIRKFLYPDYRLVRLK